MRHQKLCGRNPLLYWSQQHERPYDYLHRACVSCQCCSHYAPLERAVVLVAPPAATRARLFSIRAGPMRTFASYRSRLND